MGERLTDWFEFIGMETDLCKSHLTTNPDEFEGTFLKNILQWYLNLIGEKFYTEKHQIYVRDVSGISKN